MKKIQIQNKKRFALFIIVIIAIIGGIVYGGYRIYKHYKTTPAIEKMSLKDAAKIGEKKTVQLLLQITPTSNDGQLERGDVLLSAPEDKQFSIAEQEGFLIIKVRLTEEEQNLLNLSLNEKKGIFASEEERQSAKTLKMRKFTVDLKKIGIPDDQTIGKVISDKVFEDDIFVEKGR